MPTTRTTLATLDAAARADAFGVVYQGYTLQIHMNAAQLEAHIAANDVDPASSPLWLDHAGHVMGLGLVARRGPRAWIGGFGIAPAWRGRGLALGLVEACLAHARAADISGVGAREIELEVLAGNDRAIRSYERAGFRQTAELASFAGAIAPDDRGAGPRDAAALLRRSLAMTCWQRAPQSLAHMPGLEAVALDDDTFLLFTRVEGAVAIRHLAAARADEIARLLAATGGRTARLINEPAGSPVATGLAALGFEVFIRQHQMRMTL